MADLVVRGGTVYTPDGPRKADVHVSGGLVEAVLPWGTPAGRATVLEAEGLLVLPGAIDSHVHSRDPGFPEKENFETLSAAAAAGGVTTVLDMPNSIPGVDSGAVAEAKMEAISERAGVDHGLWGLVRAGSTEADIESLAAAGVIGLKAYLGYAFHRARGQVTYAPGADDPDLEPPPDYGTLGRLAPVAARHDLPLAIHAEDPGLLDSHARPLGTYADVLAARPALAESVAIAAAAESTRGSGVMLYVVHLASALGLEAAGLARRSGTRLIVETCPQYLWLSDGDAGRLGSTIKMFPPVRTADDRRELREGLLAGAIDLVGTDHAPHTDEEKGRHLADAAAGSPGVQWLYLSCLALAAEAGDLGLAVRWVAESPARIFGLAGKGRIEPGADADLVLVDPTASTRAGPDAARSKQRHSALDGTDFPFAVRHTLLRGKPAGTPGTGRLLRPGLRPAGMGSS